MLQILNITVQKKEYLFHISRMDSQHLKGGISSSLSDCCCCCCCFQNQVQREIKYAMTSLPWISIPTVALFFAEVRGYSKLYDSISECPLGELRRVPFLGRLHDMNLTCVCVRACFQVGQGSSSV